MPWKKTGSGFTTKQGGFVKNPAQYEAIKKQPGMTKARAAAITNAAGKANKRGKKG